MFVVVVVVLLLLLLGSLRQRRRRIPEAQYWPPLPLRHHGLPPRCLASTWPGRGEEEDGPLPACLERYVSRWDDSDGWVVHPNPPSSLDFGLSLLLLPFRMVLVVVVVVCWAPLSKMIASIETLMIEWSFGCWRQLLFWFPFDG